jgi:hypothetical protein
VHVQCSNRQPPTATELPELPSHLACTHIQSSTSTLTFIYHDQMAWLLIAAARTAFVAVATSNKCYNINCRAKETSRSVSVWDTAVCSTAGMVRHVGPCACAAAGDSPARKRYADITCTHDHVY